MYADKLSDRAQFTGEVTGCTLSQSRGGDV